MVAGGGGPAGEVRAIWGAWGWMGVGWMKGMGRRKGAVWGGQGRGGVGVDGGGGLERPSAAAARCLWLRGSAAAVLSLWVGD